MPSLSKIKGHLKTINKHKAVVTKLCFLCHLYKQGCLHDLSKYSWTELKTGFQYYQGFRSPIDAQKEEIGYSLSWLHHKGRNKHHWEYWLDNGPQGVHPVRMPVNYVIEMFCDRVAASMIYQKDQYTDRSALDYYLQGRNRIMIHPDTDQLILHLLTTLAKNGLDQTIDYIRHTVKKEGYQIIKAKE